MNERILVVDDSPTARAMISRFIGTGYRVETASGGAEALELIAARPPDLIVLDLLMPGIDGVGVLRALQSRRSTIPVVVLSADIQESTKNRVLELGASLVLHKPPQPLPLQDAIGQVLDRSKDS